MIRIAFFCVLMSLPAIANDPPPPPGSPYTLAELIADDPQDAPSPHTMAEAEEEFDQFLSDVRDAETARDESVEQYVDLMSNEGVVVNGELQAVTVDTFAEMLEYYAYAKTVLPPNKDTDDDGVPDVVELFVVENLIKIIAVGSPELDPPQPSLLQMYQDAMDEGNVILAVVLWMEAVAMNKWLDPNWETLQDLWDKCYNASRKGSREADRAKGKFSLAGSRIATAENLTLTAVLEIGIALDNHANSQEE